MATKKKNSLVENINRRKRQGKSRPKKKSTVSKEAYRDMQKGWPSSKKATKKTAAKKAAKKQSAAKSKTARNKPQKDPRGGLTAEGRKAFKQKEGANLRPGVKGAADTPEKMRRKGSFLRRHFANPRGPMRDENGEPTRLALSAHAWGEKVPKSMADAKRLAAKGTKLLEQYRKDK